MHNENIAYPAQACPTHNGTKNGGPRSNLNIVVAPHTCMLLYRVSIENTQAIAEEATSRSHVHGEKIAYPAEACPTHNGTKKGGPRSTLNIVVAPHTCMPFYCYSIENNEQLRRKPPHDHMCMVRKSHTQLRRAQHTMGPRMGGPEAL